MQNALAQYIHHSLRNVNGFYMPGNSHQLSSEKTSSSSDFENGALRRDASQHKLQFTRSNTSEIRTLHAHLTVFVTDVIVVFLNQIDRQGCTTPFLVFSLSA